MLFRADKVNLRIVFIPARSETTSDAKNFNESVFPSFFVDKENTIRLLLIVSGVSEDARAEIIFFFPLSSISRAADLTLEVKKLSRIIEKDLDAVSFASDLEFAS